MTIAEFGRRLAAFDIRKETGTIIEDNSGVVLDIQKRQLLSGKDSKGELLQSILTDPYFITPQAAVKYANWKHKLFPETPYGIANYIITGYYHGSIFISVVGNVVTTDASASFAKSIAQKNPTALGLNNQSKQTLWSDVIKSPLLRKLQDKIGGKIIS